MQWSIKQIVRVAAVGSIIDLITIYYLIDKYGLWKSIIIANITIGVVAWWIYRKYGVKL